MIKYNLKCHNDHEFESWFSDSKEFEKLKNKKMLECIYCSSNNINKSIMAPMISNLKNKNEQTDVSEKDFKNEKNKLLQLRKYIEKNFDYVGKDFSKKVREVYYDKKTKKAIYGTTTPEEREELADEGIDLLSIPWVNKDN
jgi:hypothetical protein|tara:strand:+ start:1294 stop:1716 length:423 start_codon:yes stop_codon:yes gene_type:complete